jgi:hypothetical protein
MLDFDELPNGTPLIGGTYLDSQRVWLDAICIWWFLGIASSIQYFICW